MILANSNKVDEAFIYNCRYNRVEKIGINDNIFWSEAKDYLKVWFRFYESEFLFHI